MLKLFKGVIVGLMIVGLNGCVNKSDIEVASVQDEKVNLDGYKTYQILDESGMVTEPVVSNFDVNAELKRLITTELGKKGKTPVTKDPDFYVAYLAGTDMDAIKVKVDRNGKETLENIPASSMILILVDARTSMIIGASAAEGEFKDLPLEDRKKRLDYTIKKMLGDL